MKGAVGEKRGLSAPISEWEAEIVRRAIHRAPRSPLLFPNFNGRPSRWPLASVRHICKRDGVRPFSAHDLRRTGMSILEEAGRSKVEIRWLAGHASGGDVTDDYVARASRVRTESRLLEAVKVFDEVRARIAGHNSAK
jgi:integrase